MPPSKDQVVVFGHSPYSRALSFVLGARLVLDGSPTPVGRDTHAFEHTTFVIVAERSMSPSAVVRQFLNCWAFPQLRQARFLILGFSKDLISDLLKRDVFFRESNQGENFEEWGAHIGLESVEVGLESVITALTNLKSLPLSSWRRRLRELSVVPTVLNAIENRDMRALLDCVPVAFDQDWDAICPQPSEFGTPHKHATRIQDWLKGVKLGGVPDWEEGRTLFRALKSRF